LINWDGTGEELEILGWMGGVVTVVVVLEEKESCEM
jgi:hypothetical protein